jgi:hypothetical protein
MGMAQMSQYDLTRLPLVRPLLVSRWPQFLTRAVALGGFLFAILAGGVGTPVGNRNFSIVFVWIAWWALLMLVAVPFLGRGWCNICPIPMPGEWLQQGAILGPNGKNRGFSLGRKWPRRLRHIWLQNGAFVLLALFSVVVLTRPSVTAVLFIILLVVAIATSLVYERRAFCRYLCPVGGFIGLYSQIAPVEVRVRDTAVCAKHQTKTCFTGNENGYGCPWGVFPGGMVKNTNCGTCMECLRTCPLDNIAINLRPFGRGLSQVRGRKLDEAFKAFIMLGSAIVYSAVMLGPWGALKVAAYEVGSFAWWLYALAFCALVLGVLPGSFYLATRAGLALRPTRRTPRQTFIAYAYALVPLGLAAWIAFSLSFVFANISYLWPVLSDPMGWGWDLVGTAASGWTPYLAQRVPVLQVIVLLIGLLWASVTARRIAAEESTTPSSWRQALPVVSFCLLVTSGLLWLLIG